MGIDTDFTGPALKNPLTLRTGDDKWGPFEFDCSPALPGGDAITEASASAYDEEGGEASIVEPESVTVVGETSVQLRLQAGGLIDAGKYYLRLELTLTSGGTKYLRFGPIQVLKWTSN